MKKLFGDEELEDARSSASPVQNITSFNRLVDFGVKKYVIFLYPDIQYVSELALWFVASFGLNHSRFTHAHLIRPRK